MIRIRVIGAKELSKRLTKMSKNIKKAVNQSDMEIAKGIQKGTKLRIAKRHVKYSTGEMKQSVIAQPFGKHWVVKAGQGIPYFRIQEEGGIISGWHPQFIMGLEQFRMVPGGAMKIKGRNSLRDTVDQWARGKKALKTTSRNVKRAIKEA